MGLMSTLTTAFLVGSDILVCSGIDVESGEDIQFDAQITPEYFILNEEYVMEYSFSNEKFDVYQNFTDFLFISESGNYFVVSVDEEFDTHLKIFGNCKLNNL